MRIDNWKPPIVGHVVEHGVAQDAGVVHDCIDAAEGVQRHGRERAATRVRSNRVIRGNRTATPTGDVIDNGVGGVRGRALAGSRGAEIVHDDVRSSVSKLERIRAPKPVPGAGHDDSSAVECDVHWPSPCVQGPRLRQPRGLAWMSSDFKVGLVIVANGCVASDFVFAHEGFVLVP